MKTYTLDKENIKTLVRQLLKKNTGVWTDDNTLTFQNGTKTESLHLKDTKISIEGSKILKDFKRIHDILTSAKDNMKEKDVKNTVFSNLFNSLSYYYGLETNKTLLMKLDKKFKAINIKNIIMGKNYTQQQTIQKDVCLSFEGIPESDGVESMSDDYYPRLKTFLFDTFKTNYDNKNNIPIHQVHTFSILEEEKVESIEIKGMRVGVYYPERNFIHLYYNPFSFKQITPFSSDIEIDLLLKALRKVGIRKQNVDNTTKKLFLSSFLKKSRERLKQITSKIDSVQENVAHYENKILSLISEYNDYVEEQHYINKSLEGQGKNLFLEIEKTKKLPFVKDITIENSLIKLEFIPTIISIPNFIRDTGGIEHGKRYMYIGSIGFNIHPGRLETFGDTLFKNGGNNNIHPHASGSGSSGLSTPCFGEGGGRVKIFEYLSSNRISELAKMLWFWVQTYRNSGAYIKMKYAYDDRLEQGYPVFDEKKQRIEINDSKRISTGEQTSLSKSSNYNNNIKRFKTLEM